MQEEGKEERSAVVSVLFRRLVHCGHSNRKVQRRVVWCVCVYVSMGVCVWGPTVTPESQVDMAYTRTRTRHECTGRQDVNSFTGCAAIWMRRDDGTKTMTTTTTTDKLQIFKQESAARDRDRRVLLVRGSGRRREISTFM